MMKKHPVDIIIFVTTTLIFYALLLLIMVVSTDDITGTHHVCAAFIALVCSVLWQLGEPVTVEEQFEEERYS